MGDTAEFAQDNTTGTQMIPSSSIPSDEISLSELGIPAQGFELTVNIRKDRRIEVTTSQENAALVQTVKENVGMVHNIYLPQYKTWATALQSNTAPEASATLALVLTTIERMKAAIDRCAELDLIHSSTPPTNSIAHATTMGHSGTTEHTTTTTTDTKIASGDMADDDDASGSSDDDEELEDVLDVSSIGVCGASGGSGTTAAASKEGYEDSVVMPPQDYTNASHYNPPTVGADWWDAVAVPSANAAGPVAEGNDVMASSAHSGDGGDGLVDISQHGRGRGSKGTGRGRVRKRSKRKRRGSTSSALVDLKAQHNTPKHRLKKMLRRPPPKSINK